MLKHLGLALLCLSVAHPSARSQTAPDAEKAFRDEILHKKFFLRSMSADPIVSYQWANGGIDMADPKVHTFAVFVPESVSIHPAKIEIEGNRKTLVKDKEDKYALAGDSVAVLSIAINGADASDVLRNLKDQLFITTVADALAQIPPQYVPGLPYKVAPDKKAAQTESSPPASCPTGRFKRAEVLHSEDAHLPDSQRASGRVSALVRLAFTIDETGHVADLWLARPAGNGFDEEAEKATAKYTFKPATCDGLPVQWGTYMDVTFGKF